MPQTSTASAHWDGSTVAGSGTVSTTSPAMKDAPLAWKARIGEEAGTTPEELLAAGWASCYCMAFSFALTNDGHEPTSLDASVDMEFGPTDGGFGIHGATIRVTGDVPGIDAARFAELADGAKDGCPVSQAFAGNVPVTLEATLR